MPQIMPARDQGRGAAHHQKADEGDDAAGDESEDLQVKGRRLAITISQFHIFVVPCGVSNSRK